MSTLVVKRKIHFPSFGLAKWNVKDYDRPLRVGLDQATARFVIEENKWSLGDPVAFFNGRLEIVFDPASPALTAAMRSRGKPPWRRQTASTAIT